LPYDKAIYNRGNWRRYMAL